MASQTRAGLTAKKNGAPGDLLLVYTYVGINAEACRMSITASASLSGSGGVVKSLHVQSFVYSLS